ncbi:MAG: hypothetical protein IJT57_01520 [Selenomonadaceae bacterium]|nr:hypothetical protein [Selenomonadaceae bacterium]
MSIGYGGSCRKFVEDDEFIIYEYFCYDWNEPRFSNHEKIFDGFITIRKAALIEPELREKFQKLPSGRRKKFIKKILVDVLIDELLTTGDVQIENCSRTWKILSDGADFMACRLCREIFLHYQREGKLPELYGYHV